MDDAFARSMFLEPPVIAGVRLRAFSLYHAYVLEQLESPYIAGGVPSKAQTITALIVCSTLRSQGAGPALRFWLCMRTRFAWHCRLFFCRHQKIADRLIEHIAAYFAVPEMYRKPDASAPPASNKSGAPWQWNVAVVCSSELRIDWARVWDMPICEAACMKAICDERAGGGTIAYRFNREMERFKRKGAA